jgi:hypothetical protein
LPHAHREIALHQRGLALARLPLALLLAASTAAALAPRAFATATPARGFLYKIASTGSSDAKCTGSLALTAVRTVRKKLHGHVHSVKETVTVASADVSLATPNTQTFELTLNSTGRAQLAKSHELAATLELASTSSGPAKPSPGRSSL